MPPLSLPMRACLAMALAWAGGFGLPGPAWVQALGLASALGLAWALGRGHTHEPGGRPEPEPELKPEPERSSVAGLIAMLGLAAVLALLCRTMGRVVIATPAAVWALPVVALPLALRRGKCKCERVRAWLAPAIVGIALVAGLAGARFEAAGLQARGQVVSSPILGVHPRQATAITIDGFGPHDLVVDDYVDPPGGQGYDPIGFAVWLEAELHAIAERHYAGGPARARAAFAGARVEVREALVAPADAPNYPSLLGVEVCSGTTGEGSKVEFSCPGLARDPRGLPLQPSGARGCPRKYLVDGSTGLGLAPRFPGYTEIRGRDRARLAWALGWPSGELGVDRRALAIESGIWALALVLGAGLLAGSEQGASAARSSLAAALALLAGAGALVIALIAPEIALGELARGMGSVMSVQPGPTGATLLAIVLVLGPGPRTEPRAAALPIALLLALIACSPLAGPSDALARVAAIHAGLLGLGLSWASAGALASTLALIALAAGAAVAATALVARSRLSVGPSEPGHARAKLAALGLALLVGVAVALRKPVDDLALLGGAAALVLLTSVQPRSRAARRALPPICAAAAVAPTFWGEPTWITISALAGAALLCLAHALAERRSPPTPS
jgi:hypothetical protein